jgi:hypothetical protein
MKLLSDELRARPPKTFDAARLPDLIVGSRVTLPL